MQSLHDRIMDLDMVDRDKENLMDLISARLEMNLEIDKVELFWEQRAQANWLKLGDRNMGFFHRFATQRRRVNRVSCLIKNDGSLVHDGEGLFDVADAYFTQLFTFQGQGDSRHILEGSTRVMALTKASGSDALPTLFYQKFWHIVERDIGAYCLEILNDVISTNINKTHIVLILEVANPTRMQQFHPISLCSVLYKFVLKVVSALFPGRLITDNTILAHEILNVYRRKRRGKKGHFTLKLDM
ncbi:uncharacterized protein LOC105767038 [Gossypium raimondii]|uniref:uncharacterized protein LOC105767038 n=1 Tax=Gossypium raimondii TaxID=29730 RepID=UPI00063A93A2|nr:uncharacterized protein LOC105767038 [Gossypium raimondii]